MKIEPMLELNDLIGVSYYELEDMIDILDGWMIELERCMKFLPPCKKKDDCLVLHMNCYLTLRVVRSAFRNQFPF